METQISSIQMRQVISLVINPANNNWLLLVATLRLKIANLNPSHPNLLILILIQSNQQKILREGQ
jgi:hypothetical protein